MPALSFLFPPDDPSTGSTSSALPRHPHPGGLGETSGGHQMVARRLRSGGSGHGPSGCCSARLQRLLMKPWRMRYHVFTLNLPYPFGLLLILLNLSMSFFFFFFYQGDPRLLAIVSQQDLPAYMAARDGCLLALP